MSAQKVIVAAQNQKEVVSKEPIHWHEVVRKTTSDKIFIDASFAACKKKIKGLNGITLTDHQARDVQAMIDIENNREISCSQISASFYGDMVIYTSAGRLAEKYGSGKTFIILALILLNKKLEPKPEIIYPFDFNKSRLRSELDKKFTGGFIREFKKYVKTTVIFVSSNVLSYWANQIKNYTNLTCKVIDNILRLREFEHELNSGKFEKDIILVKNGVSVHTGILGNPIKKGKKGTQPIIYSITKIFDSYGYPPQRVIVDDIDTMTMGIKSIWPTCGFFWSVSSTDRSPKIKSQYIEENDTRKYLINYHPLSSDIMSSILLNTTLNVSCKPSYTDECCAIGTPDYYLYEIKNMHYNTAEVLGALNLPNTNEIAEAFNADSPEDGARIAAEAAGIQSNNPMDLLSQILGKHRERYVKAEKDLRYIKKVLLKLDRLPEAPGGSYDKKDVKLLRGDVQAIKIRYNSPPIKDILKTWEERSEKVKSEVGPALDRAKTSLREKHCQVCGDDLEKMDVVMTICCNQVLCSTCGFHSTGIPQSKVLAGTCGQCRRPINIKSLIFLSKDFDSSKFADAAKNIAKIEFEPPKVEQKAVDTEDICKNKNDLIMRIVKGKSHPKTQIDVQVKGLLLGKEKLPVAKENERKILIFSNHGSILADLCKSLEAAKIGFLTLQGSSKQRFEQVEDFRNNKKIKVLILNSMKACAGIDMPFTTDMIFCHEFLDKEIQGQASGRAQRMGRKHKMTYHYVLYDNEIRHFAHKVMKPNTGVTLA